MRDYLYDKVTRVPEISDEQIAEMRHIHPIFKAGPNRYQRIKGVDKIDARKVAFLWDAEPTGPEFFFDQLNEVEIITQHYSSVFLKPSLAEVYAWIRLYMPETWEGVRFFWLDIDNYHRFSGCTNWYAPCYLFGGPMKALGKMSYTATWI